MVVQQRIVPHSVEVEVNAWSQPMLDWYKGECVTMVSKNLLDRYQNCNTSHILAFQGERLYTQAIIWVSGILIPH